MRKPRTSKLRSTIFATAIPLKSISNAHAVVQSLSRLCAYLESSPGKKEALTVIEHDLRLGLLPISIEVNLVYSPPLASEEISTEESSPTSGWETISLPILS